jgi:hypothetical protein
MGLGTSVQSRGYQFNLAKILLVMAAMGAGSGAPAEGLLGRLFELSMTGPNPQPQPPTPIMILL